MLPAKSDESLSSEVFTEGVIMSWQTKRVVGVFVSKDVRNYNNFINYMNL